MKILHAGPLTAGYENGFLRRISYGENEVLRMIYFALRDHNWNTFPHVIEREDISHDDAGFRIRYESFNASGGVTFMEWKATIEGRADGTIIFEIHGTATEDFQKNRAGFCVLHPLHLTGERATIRHPDQTTTTAPFPTTVSAVNPFKNINAMEWVSSGVPFSLEFEGDTFETEDQRNWSDASFKTFCTPLDIPFPVRMRRGDRVFQRITFKPGAELSPRQGHAAEVLLRDTGIRGVLPFFGVAASTEVKALSSQAVGLIRDLRLRHYRVDVYPGNDQWVTEFSEAYEGAYSLGLPLEAVVHLTEDFREELASFVVLCLQNRVKLRKVLLLQTGRLVTGQAVIGEARQIRNAIPGVPVGAGTDFNFNEINKNHFAGGDVDFVSFAIDPQEHAVDDLTVLENIEAQEHLIRSAQAIYGATMPIHISPITLRKRYNPYATNPADLFLPEEQKSDPRQREDFAAIWTFGSLLSLSAGGAVSVTLYQTVGGQGILSRGGEPYPVYETLKRFSPWQGKEVSMLGSSDPMSVQGVVLGGSSLAVANMTQEEKTVRFNGSAFLLRPREVRFHSLDRSQQL